MLELGKSLSWIPEGGHLCGAYQIDLYQGPPTGRPPERRYGYELTGPGVEVIVKDFRAADEALLHASNVAVALEALVR